MTHSGISKLSEHNWSCRQRRRRSVAMQNVGVSPYSPGHMWLSLVALLVSILTMPGTEGTGTRYAWSAAHEGAAFADTSLQASAPPVSTRSVAQRTSEPGRLDVIEQPGRQGVTEQPS